MHMLVSLLMHRDMFLIYPFPSLFRSLCTQALFQRAQAGDKEAVEALQDEFTQQHYTGTSSLLSFNRIHVKHRIRLPPLPLSLYPSLPPGLDGKAFREISKAQNADKLEQLPEIMHFIEKEPSLAKVFKDCKSRMMGGGGREG